MQYITRVHSSFLTKGKQRGPQCSAFGWTKCNEANVTMQERKCGSKSH